ncbi:MAG: leucine-rich repeat protein [Clostridiales bacterium]|nr:leucine-rich repeat protein [Clostridiales bacterium]
MQFKDKLKSLRKEAGLTQKELAQQVYVSRSAVARWESGFGLPGEESLKMLAEYFNIGTNELVCNTEMENLIVGKNRTIVRKNIMIAVVAVISLSIIVILSILLFGSFGKMPYEYSAVVDGVRYKISPDGGYYSACGLANTEIVGNQNHKKTLVIADNINKIPVRTIEQYAFYDVSCEEIYFGKNLLIIEYGAFQKASISKSIHFEACENLIEIEANAFAQCNFNQTSIRLPDSLKKIHSGAFVNCNSLTEIEFGRSSNGTLIIDNGAVSCVSLEKIVFNGPVQIDGFDNCYNLREICIFGDIDFVDNFNIFKTPYALETVKYYGKYKDFIEKYELVFYGLDFRIVSSDYDGPVIWDTHIYDWQI